MNKLAIVTGASSGIGQATARRLAKLGYNLVITARRRERLEKLAEELISTYGIKIQILCFDVRDREATEQALSTIDKSMGDICVLMNNAGLAAGLEHIDQGSTDDWDRMIDTNVKGVLYVTRIVSQMMIAAGKGGHIFNVGSIAGIQTYENGAVYCASKHAMHALSQGMRIDFLKHGIKVTELRPGMVETEFSTVRFHGDQERADNVYKGVSPLVGDDIAAVVEYCLSLPAHVNLNDIEIMPTQQANAYYTHRN